jgi:hypothetical protein
VDDAHLSCEATPPASSEAVRGRLADEDLGDETDAGELPRTSPPASSSPTSDLIIFLLPSPSRPVSVSTKNKKEKSFFVAFFLVCGARGKTMKRDV